MKKTMSSIKKYFNCTNSATRALIFLGILSLIHTIITVFFDFSQGSPSDVAIRSVMSNIFGFIFGEQTVENSNMKNKNSQTCLAFIIALACLVVSMISHWIRRISPTNVALIELRNLLFVSLGFLLSRAKSENRSSK